MSIYTAVQLATALQAYAVRSKSDKSSQVSNLLEETGLRKGSFDRMFPAMFSLHGLDIKQALESAVVSKDITPRAAEIALLGINAAMEDLASLYPVLDVSTFKQIESVAQDIVNEFNVGGTDIVNKDKANNIGIHVNKMKALFKHPWIVSYFKGDSERVASLKIAHNSFSNLRDIVNKRIRRYVLEEAKKAKVTNSKILDSTFLTTQIINWGHTQVGGNILTGKLIAELISARGVLGSMSSPDALIDIVVKDFLENTGQEKTVIKVHQGDLTLGDTEVLSLVVSSNVFQKVIVQNKRENQEELGQLEKKWSLVEAVARNNLLKAFGVSNTRELLDKMLNVRSSPTVLEKMDRYFLELLEGKKPTKTSKTIPLLNHKKDIVKKRRSVKVKSNANTKPLKQATPIKLPESSIALDKLLMNINVALASQIRENMGTGDSRNILNYRTGRFAKSVRVTRLTQSREGMISAFYTYMKNPYATFSADGAQELPKSRDPKLLISKSIREIATKMAYDRMRAVLV